MSLKQIHFVDFRNYDSIHRMDNDFYIDDLKIRDYDFVFFGFMSKHSNLSYLLVNYLEKNNVPILKYETYSMYDTKSFGYDLEFNAYKAYDRTYTEFRYLIITIF